MPKNTNAPQDPDVYQNKNKRKRAARERLQAERARQAKRAKVRRQLIVAACAVVVAALVVGGVVLAMNASGGGSDKPVKIPSAAKASSKDGTVITYGSKSAKNTLVVYEDPRCPYCASFEQTNGDTVKSMADKGRFKVEYHFGTFLDDNLGGSGSKHALNALGAAANESAAKFLALHKVLYDNHPDEHDDAFANAGHLISLAKKVPGLDTPAFEKAVKNYTYQPWVKKVSDSFNKSGIQGTPTVKLNGKTLNVLNNKGTSISSAQFTGLVDKQIGTK